VYRLRFKPDTFPIHVSVVTVLADFLGPIRLKLTTNNNTGRKKGNEDKGKGMNGGRTNRRNKEDEKEWIKK
jgi:hypothetical protein